MKRSRVRIIIIVRARYYFFFFPVDDFYSPYDYLCTVKAISIRIHTSILTRAAAILRIPKGRRAIILPPLPCSGCRQLSVLLSNGFVGNRGIFIVYNISDVVYRHDGIYNTVMFENENHTISVKYFVAISYSRAYYRLLRGERLTARGGKHERVLSRITGV